VRTRVIQRRDRFAAVTGDNGRDALMDVIERFIPGDALEGTGALWPGPPQRMHEAAGAMNEVGRVVRHLVADGAGGERQNVGASHLGDTPCLDRHFQAAGIGTVQRADAGVLLQSHRTSSPSRLMTRVAHRVSCKWIYSYGQL
jgi:hypothetical protein